MFCLASKRIVFQSLAKATFDRNIISNRLNKCINNLSTTHNPESILKNLKDKCSTYSLSEGYVRHSPYDSVTVPNTTVDKYVWNNYRKWENKIAVECIQSGKKYTYSKLRDCSAALAIQLQKKFQLKQKDVIAVCLPNIPDYAVCVLGSIEAGQAVTTVNPIYTPDEIARQLINSETKLIFGFVGNYKILRKACEIAKLNIPIVCVRTITSETLPSHAIDFHQLIETNGIIFSDLKETNINQDDVVFLPYSSGTTGLPKGVVLTHKNVISDCEIIRTNSPFERYIHQTTETHQDIIPCVLPFFHIYGLVVCLTSKLNLGCKLVTLMKFTPNDFLRSLNEYKATLLYSVPPMVLFLTNNPTAKAKDMKSLRTVLCGAAPVGKLDAEKFSKKYQHINFTQGYGLTETSGVSLLSPIGTKNFASAGLVLPSLDLKIVAFDDDKHIGLGPNKTGELWIRGPSVMKGYLNNEEANRDIFRPGNWLRTGDVAYYDEDGYFYITDRMKELIKVKGFQVPPAELEELLRDHPKILDAAVIGIPHPQYGEVPRAFVVLKPEQTATEQEIQNFIKNKVIEYKRLEGGVEFLNEIPKTASGKILRKELKLKIHS